ncbi:MAG: ribulose-phosphate 3-epimerase [Lachnospiraceae bacterium]|jgi:ribulose-phosphate 3-epimerase|nr:ribulose-phosphate 3-epimerase [Lachnospiraceae bacterium]
MSRAMISPSVMCISEWQGAKEILCELEKNHTDLLHTDVMDGAFVPNLMLGTESIKHLRKITSIPLDIHMMVEHPEDKLSWFDIQPGEYVSVHVESTRHLQKALAGIREYGAHPMAALNPATPLCSLEDVLEDVDGVVVMTVNPGFAGQKLVPQTLDKISRLRKMLADAGMKDKLIEVDGNVSFVNAPKMRRAGADIFVCGTSSVFGREGTIQENIAHFREALQNFEAYC